jgi:chemotaxis protein methyltransferase CheR
MTISAEAGVPGEFELFCRRAVHLTGMDLSSYKAPQMNRRLSALLARHGIANYTDYARVLERDEARRKELRDYVTINVSEFFRDMDRFSALEQRVLPELLAGGAGLRVWSAGCSNGAEPYSLLILLRELAPGRGHSILATDVDETILARARTGNGYLASDVRNVRADLLRRWFTGQPDGQYAVAPEARTSVRFVKHDLLRDVYPSGPFDLIACRNVVIYFTEAARERILERLVRALRPGGVLFVGGTEAIMLPEPLGLSVTGPGFYRKTS